MPNNRDRILAYLRDRAPEGFDDDALSEFLAIRPRQQVNQICRRLASEGLIDRRQVSGRIRNFSVGTGPPAIEQPSGRRAFSEDSVKQAIKKALAQKGYERIEVAWGKKHGKDITAKKNALTLWVTVKGYPPGTKKTKPETQARHYMEAAAYDIATYRGENPDTMLAIGLPDVPTYQRLAAQLRWFQRTAKFSFIWVVEDGTVRFEDGAFD